jgi:ribosomal RNA-processing protein 7
MPDYTTLPVRFRGRAFLSQLFARPHVGRSQDADLPANRTMFVLNVPLHVTADELGSAFSTSKDDQQPVAKLGRLEADGDGDAHTAHIIFSQASALKRALNRKKPLELPAAKVSTKERPPTREELQERVGSFMEEFEAAERERELAEEAAHNQMDSDGCGSFALRKLFPSAHILNPCRCLLAALRFVVVTRKRKGRNTSTEESSGATVGVASASRRDDGDDSDDGARLAKKKKKKAQDMPNFYHFQRHEAKREQLLKLREQFEQDKQRIARMRADRKFKPAGY